MPFGRLRVTNLGFDNELYLREQTAAILERVGRFSGKLYLEFGGKLTFDRQKYGVAWKATMKDMVLQDNIELTVELVGKAQ